MRASDEEKSQIKLQTADELFKELLVEIESIKKPEDSKKPEQFEIVKKLKPSFDSETLKNKILTSLKKIIDAESSSSEEKAKAYWYSYIICGITEFTLADGRLDGSSLLLANGWLKKASELGSIPAIACQLLGIQNLKDVDLLENKFYAQAYKKDSSQQTLNALSQLGLMPSFHGAWAISQHYFTVAKNKKDFQKGLVFFEASVTNLKKLKNPNYDLFFDRYFQFANICETNPGFKDLSKAEKIYELIYTHSNAQRKHKLQTCEKLLSFYERGSDGMERIDFQKIAEYCEKIYDLSRSKGRKDDIIQKLTDYLTHPWDHYTAEEKRPIKVHYKRLITQLTAGRDYQEAKTLLQTIRKVKDSQDKKWIAEDIRTRFISSANGGNLRALLKLARYSINPLDDSRPSRPQAINYYAEIIALHSLGEYANLSRFKQSNQQAFEQAKQKLFSITQNYKGKTGDSIGDRAARLYVLFFKNNQTERKNIANLENLYPNVTKRKKQKSDLTSREKLALWQNNIDIPESLKKKIDEKLTAMRTKEKKKEKKIKIKQKQEIKKEIEEFELIKKTKDNSAMPATDDTAGIPEQSLPATFTTTATENCTIVQISEDGIPRFIQNSFRIRAIREINNVPLSKNIQLRALETELESSDALIKIEDLEQFKQLETVKLNKEEQSCFGRLKQIAISESICRKHGHLDVNKFKYSALEICEREIADHQSGLLYTALRKEKNTTFEKLRKKIARTGDTQTLEQSLSTLTRTDMEIINGGILARAPYKIAEIHDLARQETESMQNQQKKPNLSSHTDEMQKQPPFSSVKSMKPDEKQGQSDSNNSHPPYQPEEFKEIRPEQRWESKVSPNNSSERPLLEWNVPIGEQPSFTSLTGVSYSPTLWSTVLANTPNLTPQNPQLKDTSTPSKNTSNANEGEKVECHQS